MPKLYHDIRKPIKLLECKGFIFGLAFLIVIAKADSLRKLLAQRLLA